MELAFLTAAAFVFGTVIGSFLNVVSLRMNTGVGVGGRSRCMSCGKALGWTELVPVLSYAAQAGRCRGCKSRISAQYPAVELATGALFALIAWRMPPVSIAAAALDAVMLAIMSILVVAAVYDIRHKIIPDALSYSFAALALISAALGPSGFDAPGFWALLAGPVLALPFALLWLASRGRWIGLGDAKLALGIGWLLGLGAGANAVILAFWIGAAVGVVWMLGTYGRMKRRMEIPFGPFLMLGTLIVLFTGFQAIDFHLAASLIAGSF